MAEVGLQRSGIDPFIRQRVAAGVPEHVRVDLKTDPGLLARAGDEAWQSPTG